MNMTLETIRAAHARIAPYIVQTPLLRLPALDDALGCEVYVKAECMQRTGAFKLRGAMNKILTLTDAERVRGFVAASSGNHGRAVAYAAQRFGTHACIVMPETAPAVKQAAIRALGAASGLELIFAGTSLSANAYEQLCTRLEGTDFCLLLTAQDAVSIECGVASRAVRWLLDRRYGPEARQHIFVCAPQGSLLHTMAKEEGYTFLPQPAQLGCADSALSPAALLPMAAAGIEPLALLEGAEQAYHDYDLRAFENPAWMYAGARHALELRARRTEFLGVFEPALLPFARWLAGNTARRSCRGGYGVLPVPAELPGSLDAMDAMLAGSRSAFETFLRVPLPARKRKIELDWKDYDGLGYLSGHAVDEADGAMFDALVQTHASLDVPLIVLSAQTLDAPQLGELFYFFELTAALCAATDGLSPFDRKFSSPTRAQTATLLQKSAE